MTSVSTSQPLPSEGLLTSILSKAAGKKRKSSAVIDNELDEIFRNSAGSSIAVPPPVPTSVVSVIEPKATEKDSLKQRKRKRGEKAASPSSSSIKLAKTASDPKPKKLKSDVDDEIDDDDEAIEDAYYQKRTARVRAKSQSEADVTEDPSAHSENDLSDNMDDPLPTHESLSKPTGGQAARKKTNKYVKEGETAEEKARRTIFIGNLPVDIVKSKSSTKSLLRHITTLVPGSKVDSIRFRSIAFDAPTEKKPLQADSEKNEKKPSTSREQRDADRVTRWQADQQAEESPAKVYLNPQEKRRIAFIKKEFHPEAASINAYVVFAYPDPQRPANVVAIMDPFKAVEKAVELCDGTVFLERTLRVDRTIEKTKASVSKGDPKLTLFVGNLEFSAKEEDLRVFFDTLLAKEVESSNDQNDQRWVKHVRVIRDPATQLGKGFAYVEFVDRSAVDELLAMDETKVKFAKRKLRLQRCKTLPGSSLSKLNPPAQSVKSLDKSTERQKGGHRSRNQAVVSMPKGDPLLGNKLKDLSKEERKAIKASDPTRMARRIAKKKARHVLSQKGVREKGKEKKHHKTKILKTGNTRKPKP